MKKGQLFSQPFMYLFLVIVAFFVLFFGVKMVSNLVDFGGEVSLKEFAVNFDTKVQGNYLDNQGSVTSLKSIRVPTDIQEVCIVDFDKDIDIDNVNNEKFKEIFVLLDTNSDENLIIYGDDIDGSFQTFEIENLITGASGNPTCSLVNSNEINMKVRNTGKKSEIFVAA